MKKSPLLFQLIFFFSLISHSSFAIDQALAPENYFDFWLGEWNLKWYHEDGSVSTGYNRIVKILDGKVIQENFESYSEKEEVPLKGMSLSVYNPRSQQWHQAWTDNQGSYFNFIGEVEGDTRIFSMETSTPEGGKMIFRMVFSNIEEDSLLWTWEASDDGGDSWKQRWQIHYERRIVSE